MKASELMTSPAITVAPETPIREVAAVMRKNQISGLPVVDAAGKLLGMVTEINLIKRNAPIIGPNYITVLSGLIPIELGQYRRYREQLRQVLATTAGELMTPDVEYVSPRTELETLMELMEDPNVTSLPVVDHEQVIGIVTRTDLVRLIEQLEMTSEEPPQLLKDKE
ncbi:MAG: CBS domain-containing protein [Caldilineaceae bacterium]